MAPCARRATTSTHPSCRRFSGRGQWRRLVTGLPRTREPLGASPRGSIPPPGTTDIAVTEVVGLSTDQSRNLSARGQTRGGPAALHHRDDDGPQDGHAVLA